MDTMGSIKTEMESLNASVGALRSENSCTEQDPASSSVCGLKNLSSSLNNLAPASLTIPAFKFEENGEPDIQSPDNSLWESIFSDQLVGDFMICSPVRNGMPSLPHPPNYNHAQGIRGQSLAVCSPPRFAPHLGPHRGKGLSPVHRLLISPGNQFMQVEQVESLSLPALESLLDDDTYDKGDDFLVSSWGKVQGAGEGSTDRYSALTTMPEVVDCLSLLNSTGFCGSVVSDNRASVQGISQGTPQNGIYRFAPQPLSQHLQREREQQEQQQQHPAPSRIQRQPQILHQQNQLQNMHNTLEHDSGLQLVHLLACAEVVSKEDYRSARRYLNHLNRVVSPLGDSMQRVASCFTEALCARLAATLANLPRTSNPKPFHPFPPDSQEILYQACPYIKFAHFTANQSIFEAFEAEERVHVIDLDIVQGYRWPAFMQALAARPGGAPFLRITGVGPSPESVRETGRCLAELARSLQVPYEFHPVGEKLGDLQPHMFNRRVGEALADNSVNRLHRAPGNSLGNLLAMIRDQAPNIVTIVEQEASHNGPYFLGRFLEALHYYSAIFDSLDATFPPDSAQRAKVEQLIFAQEVRNIVAHEGPERVMRHERLEKWRKIMEGKGFQGVPLSSNAATQYRILLGLYSCDGYRLTEHKGCLLLGWQDRSIIAASAWRC